MKNKLISSSIVLAIGVGSPAIASASQNFEESSPAKNDSSAADAGTWTEINEGGSADVGESADLLPENTFSSSDGEELISIQLQDGDLLAICPVD